MFIGKIVYRLFVPICTVGVALSVASVSFAQGAYQPGQKVEYKVRGWPPTWKVGTVEYMTPSGSQVIVREKPDDYNPTGGTSAYALDEVRPATGAAGPDPVDTAKAQFKPGMAVSYPGGVGTVEYVTPSGKQVIVREPPNQYYPQGNTRAYNLDELKVGGQPAAQPAIPQQQPAAVAAVPAIPPFPVPRNPAAVPQQNPPRIPNANVPAARPGAAGAPMSKEEIKQYYVDKMIDHEHAIQLADDTKAAIHAELRRQILARGVDFVYDRDFSNEIGWAMPNSTVTKPMEKNFGVPATENFFYGSWGLLKVGGDYQFVQNNKLMGAGVAWGDEGSLKIDPGTHKCTWTTVDRQVHTGAWRAATPAELGSGLHDKGGEGIVLDGFQQGAVTNQWIMYKNTSPGTNAIGIKLANLDDARNMMYGAR